MPDTTISDGPESGQCRVDEPYLLALNIPLRSYRGALWADASWGKDLVRHLSYISKLVLFCPVEALAPEPGWIEVPAELHVVGYPAPRSTLSSLTVYPLVLLRLAREVRRARIVHSGVAGWPIPLGWPATLLARMFGRKLVLIVESAFWRMPVGATPGLLGRVRSAAWEAAARACMAQADYAAYTQPDYQRSLPARRAKGGHLIRASWVDTVNCLSDEAAVRLWREKTRAGRPKFLFAARLAKQKGTDVLIAALDELARKAASVEIHIIGEGVERPAIAASIGEGWSRDHVRLIDPVPYGPEFLDLVSRYHALLVPILSDEQPRIVYDGYSQAVPSIGSDLPGLRACVEDGVTGRLVEPGHAPMLAEAILAAAAASDVPETWGMAGLGRVRTLTHERLHADRCVALRAMLST